MRFVLFFTILLGLFACSSSHEQHGGHQAASGGCNFCGMPYEKYPQFNAQLSTAKGEQFFCSTRCLLYTVLDPKTKPADIRQIQVTDYYQSKKIDINTAYFVAGSTQSGPMGNDLLPVATEEAAKELMQDYNGQQIVRFADLTLEKLNSLLSVQ